MSNLATQTPTASGQTALNVKAADLLPIRWIHPRGVWPSFSPCGEKIVFTQAREDGGSSLWIIDSDGSNPHLLYPPEGTIGINATRPDWSWNADNIAFSVNGREIYTVHPDGTGAAPPGSWWAPFDPQRLKGNSLIQ